MSQRHRSFICLLAGTLTLAGAGTVLGQDDGEMHSDIEFGYDLDENKIEVEFGPEGQVFEGEFETSGVDLQTTSEPGFESEPPEFGNLPVGDEFVYNVLGPLQFWNGTSIAPVAVGTQIRIENVGNDVPDTVITGTSGPQPGVPFSVAGTGADTRNRLGAADSAGEFHTDLKWTLEPLPGSPAMGAYAVKISLSTDATGIADSDPFFIVQNFGLGEDMFEAGVEAFAAQIPEPTSLALVGTATAVLSLTRRRRKSSLQQQ